MAKAKVRHKVLIADDMSPLAEECFKQAGIEVDGKTGLDKEGPGAMDWSVLTLCQCDAAEGLYAQAMAGYLRWLATKYKEIQAELKTKISELREQAYLSGQHRRTSDIVANLAVGFHYFLTFAQESGAIDQNQAEELWRRCWSALGEAALAQGEHQADSEPVGRFLELLAAALSSGRSSASTNVLNAVMTFENSRTDRKVRKTMSMTLRTRICPTSSTS